MEDSASRGWVFGYGSLMWRPGFEFLERRPAVHHGRRRAFCIYSVHHRGTPDHPGLVLGLAPGGSVRGVIFRVADPAWDSVMAYLREREQPTETYVEASVLVRPVGGPPLRAVTFLSDVTHPQWAGRLPLNVQADLIARSAGLSGRNIDYLRDLVEHLRAEGIVPRTMERLLAAAQERVS